MVRHALECSSDAGAIGNGLCTDSAKLITIRNCHDRIVLNHEDPLVAKAQILMGVLRISRLVRHELTHTTSQPARGLNYHQLETFHLDLAYGAFAVVMIACIWFTVDALMQRVYVACLRIYDGLGGCFHSRSREHGELSRTRRCAW